MVEDVSDIVANLTILAQKFQRENGGFLPFGQVCENGERKYQASDEESASAIIGSLNNAYRTKVQRALIEWAALCIDVRFTDAEAFPQGTDAIIVDYEDQDGGSLTYVRPYRARPDGGFEYLPAFVRPKEVRWFLPSETQEPI